MGSLSLLNHRFRGRGVFTNRSRCSGSAPIVRSSDLRQACNFVGWKRVGQHPDRGGVAFAKRGSSDCGSPRARAAPTALEPSGDGRDMSGSVIAAYPALLWWQVGRGGSSPVATGASNARHRQSHKIADAAASSADFPHLKPALCLVFSATASIPARRLQRDNLARRIRGRMVGEALGARIFSWTARSRSITPVRRCATVPQTIAMMRD